MKIYLQIYFNQIFLLQKVFGATPIVTEGDHYGGDTQKSISTGMQYLNFKLYKFIKKKYCGRRMKRF